ncbi:hypothetical protein KCU65_g2569, partial [Aureobasidium melanogenum]
MTDSKDDEDFISGLHGNPSVFDNARDSDLTLVLGKTKIHVHKVVLRIWSPFFDRSLASQFSVANSTTFEIDDEYEGDCEPLYAILKHIYGMPLGDHPQNDECNFSNSSTIWDFITKTYIMADKYDFPSVRLTIRDLVRLNLRDGELSTEYWEKNSNVLEGLPDCIANICGPDAPQLADDQLRRFLLKWVYTNWGLISRDAKFRARILDGSLLDTSATATLLLDLGCSL